MKDNIPRSKSELSKENAWLQHLIYQVRLLSPIVRDSLVLHATRFISMIQSKHEYEEINELNLQVNTLKELVGDRLLSDSFLSWLINKINLQSENTYCLSYLEEYHGHQWNIMAINDIAHVIIPYLYTIFYPIKHIIVIQQVGKYQVN